MKPKSHSGAKKRLKVRKSGKVMSEKSAKNHLLTNKSKRQKESFKSGMPIHKTRVKYVRQMLPGKVPLQGKVKVRKEAEVEA